MNLVKRLSSALLIVAIAGFTLLPANNQAEAASFITFDKFSGRPGSSVKVSGGGWTNGETVSIYVNSVSDKPAATATANKKGAFGPLSIKIPADASQGALPIVAVGSKNNTQKSNTYYIVPFNPSVTLGGSNAPGSILTAKGKGFSPGETVILDLGDKEIGKVKVDSKGNFSKGKGNIPADLTAGTYTFNATGQSSKAVAKSFLYVRGFYPGVWPSAFYVLPGHELKFSGAGFAPGETVDVLDDQHGSTPLVSAKADAKGNIKNVGPVTVPVDFTGAKTYNLVGQKSKFPVAIEIMVGKFNPLVNPTYYKVTKGKKIDFWGTGFAKKEKVVVTDGNDGPVLASFTTDSKGNFSNKGGFIIPYSWGNKQTVYFIGQSSHASKAIEIKPMPLTPLVYFSSYYLTAGQKTNVWGKGFGPNEKVTMTSDGTDPITATTDKDGVFKNVTVKAGLGEDRQQTYTFKGESSGVAVSMDLSISGLHPLVWVDNYYPEPGKKIKVTGSNFLPGETVTISVGTASSTAKVGKDGVVKNAPITLPVDISGQGTLTVTGNTSKVSNTAEFKVKPYIPQLYPSTWFTPVGSEMTFKGQGFAPGETVSIKLGDSDMGTVTANSKGEFNTSKLAIPFGVQEAAKFTFTGNTSHATKTIPISVAQLRPAVLLSSYYSTVGMPVTIKGMGFGSKENVKVTFGGQDLGSHMADAKGNFSFSTTVPDVTAGNVSVTAQGEKSNATDTATFTIAKANTLVQLKSYNIAPGEKVTFVGTGYRPGENIEISNNRQDSSKIYRFQADAKGNFTDSSFIIPAEFEAGPMMFTVRGEHTSTPIDINVYVKAK